MNDYQQTGHQLPSVAEAWRQWHNGEMFCYKMQTIPNFLLYWLWLKPIASHLVKITYISTVFDK